MSDLHKFEYQLSSALSEPNLFKARNALNDMVAKVKCLLKSTPTDELRRLSALGYGHLANLADKVTDRTRYRALALKVCSEGLKVFPESAVLSSTYANAVVDWVYDPFAPTDRKLMLGNLARAWRNCKNSLKSECPINTRVNLLVQWASVLRCQAHMFGVAGGGSYAERAERISEAAVEEDHTNSLAHLDKGLSQWANARWAQSESDFFLRVQSAEASLTTSHSMGLPLATLCLARLYRQTYRPSKALDWFEEYARREERRRVVLSNAYLAGESAVLLLHRDIDPAFLKERLRKSEKILFEAVQAGYKNARILVSLARIRFALGDEIGGLGFLQEVVRDNGTNWTLAVEKAKEAIQSNDLDLLHRAFALGMTDGLVWNSLGTFAKEVMHDSMFAIQLYEVGLLLSPHSPVIHTNIARICLSSSDQLLLPKINRHLEMASKYADFAFRWWKPLYVCLQEKLSNNQSLLRAYRVRDESDSLDRIYAEFVGLEEAAGETTNRGKKFEELFVRTLKLTFGTEYVAGNIDLDGIQSDATFRHGAFYYRVEISWDNRQNDRSEIDKLISRLARTNGTRGVLVSMSGFTHGVAAEVERQKPNYTIFLICREEYKAVLRGEIRLESLIEEKEARAYLNKAGELAQPSA